MVIRGKEITNLSLMKDLIWYNEKHFEEILISIYSNLEYDYQAYSKDFELVKKFLQKGEGTQLRNYLRFVTYIVNKHEQELDEYWLLFSSAKLFHSYGSIIQNYSDEYKLLLSDLYMFTSVDRMIISEDILSEGDFFLREQLLHKTNYNEMFAMLLRKKIEAEYAHDQGLIPAGKVLH